MFICTSMSNYIIFNVFFYMLFFDVQPTYTNFGVERAPEKAQL